MFTVFPGFGEFTEDRAVPATIIPVDGKVRRYRDGMVLIRTARSLLPIFEYVYARSI